MQNYTIIHSGARKKERKNGFFLLFYEQLCNFAENLKTKEKKDGVYS